MIPATLLFRHPGARRCLEDNAATCVTLGAQTPMLWSARIWHYTCAGARPAWSVP